MQLIDRGFRILEGNSGERGQAPGVPPDKGVRIIVSRAGKLDGHASVYHRLHSWRRKRKDTELDPSAIQLRNAQIGIE